MRSIGRPKKVVKQSLSSPWGLKYGQVHMGKEELYLAVIDYELFYKDSQDLLLVRGTCTWPIASDNYPHYCFNIS